MYRRTLGRREFLTTSAGSFFALHLFEESLGSAPAPPQRAIANLGTSVAQASGKPAKPRIRGLRLKTHVLSELKTFYSTEFKFPIVAETPTSVSFDAGQTRLEFEQVTDGTKPYYHFAFNIPENKLDQAREWLAERVPILRHAQTGNEVIHFAHWNAHSVFFYDPAGNLGELIARHTLPNAAEGAFDHRDILYASEIGIVPPDQERVFADIRESLQIQPYLESNTFLGDEYGILIVIPQQRLWIPEFKKTGMLAPTRINVSGHGGRKVKFPDYSIEILSE